MYDRDQGPFNENDRQACNIAARVAQWKEGLISSEELVQLMLERAFITEGFGRENIDNMN